MQNLLDVYDARLQKRAAGLPLGKLVGSALRAIRPAAGKATQAIRPAAGAVAGKAVQGAKAVGRSAGRVMDKHPNLEYIAAGGVGALGPALGTKMMLGPRTQALNTGDDRSVSGLSIPNGNGLATGWGPTNAGRPYDPHEIARGMMLPMLRPVDRLLGNNRAMLHHEAAPSARDTGQGPYQQPIDAHPHPLPMPPWLMMLQQELEGPPEEPPPQRLAPYRQPKPTKWPGRLT